MPRARRALSDLFGDFERELSQLGSHEHWDETTFVLLVNEEKDLLEMQLQGQHEGFSEEIWSTDLIQAQVYYEIPAHTGRVKRVLRKFENHYQPLLRQEHLSTPEAIQGGQVSGMTYRLLGDFIVVSPPPGENVTGGLRIEIEVATERLAAGDSLPLSFPIFSETLLVLRAVAAAWGQEESEDTTRSLPTYFARRLQQYEAAFSEYTSTRSFGRQPGVRFVQGG